MREFIGFVGLSLDLAANSSRAFIGNPKLRRPCRWVAQATGLCQAATRRSERGIRAHFSARRFQVPTSSPFRPATGRTAPAGRLCHPCLLRNSALLEIIRICEEIRCFRPLTGGARRLRGGNCVFPQCLRALPECWRRLFGCNSRLFEGKCQLLGHQWRLLNRRRRLPGRQFPLLNCQRRLPDCKWRLLECRRSLGGDGFCSGDCVWASGGWRCSSAKSKIISATAAAAARCQSRPDRTRPSPPRRKSG